MPTEYTSLQPFYHPHKFINKESNSKTSEAEVVGRSKQLFSESARIRRHFLVTNHATSTIQRQKAEVERVWIE